MSDKKEEEFLESQSDLEDAIRDFLYFARQSGRGRYEALSILADKLFDASKGEIKMTELGGHFEVRVK